MSFSSELGVWQATRVKMLWDDEQLGKQSG